MLLSFLRIQDTHGHPVSEFSVGHPNASNAQRRRRPRRPLDSEANRTGEGEEAIFSDRGSYTSKSPQGKRHQNDKGTSKRHARRTGRTGLPLFRVTRNAQNSSWKYTNSPSIFKGTGEESGSICHDPEW